jgi:hypothetical protein
MWRSNDWFWPMLAMTITCFDDLDDTIIDTFLEPFSKAEVVCDLSFPKDIVDVRLEDTLNTEGDIIQYGHDEHATMGFQQTQLMALVTCIPLFLRFL